METPGVWNVILDGDIGPLAPGSSRHATNACCVYTVTELTNKDEKIAIHIHLHPSIHTQYFTTMRETI